MALEFNTCNSPLKDFSLREAAKRAEQARASGTERVRPLRIVLISSFYYAALAAGIIDKKEDYRYQSALDVRQKCRALAEVDPAKKFASLTEAELKEKSREDRLKGLNRDVANAARLEIVLCLLFGEPNLECAPRLAPTPLVPHRRTASRRALPPQVCRVPLRSRLED